MSNPQAICINSGSEVIVEGHDFFLARIDGVPVGVEGVCGGNTMLLKHLPVAVDDNLESLWSVVSVLV